MSESPADFGRVEHDGSVYLILDSGERLVGQVPDATPEEAMSFFTRRFDALETEVGLLETRVRAAALSPEEARKSIEQAKQNVAEANAVGNLPALSIRLDALLEELPAQIEARKQAKAQQRAQAITAKEEMVQEAETLAQSEDWRGGVERFRELLEQWKAVARVDKATDDDLWRRFSGARTIYTRRRKAHFAELGAQRDEAKRTKERIIAEATPLAESTDWGPTSTAFRELMNQWKAAGSARRAEDEALWKRFRAIQDQFFEARNAANEQADEEQSANLAAKQELLTQVRSDLEGVGEAQEAKKIHRSFLSKFNEIGHVPRSAKREVDEAVRAVGDQVAALEAEQWRRTDPEARQRAEDTVALFAGQVEKLERDLARAEESDDKRRVGEINKSLETYQGWLAQARETLAEFQG